MVLFSQGRQQIIQKGESTAQNSHHTAQRLHMYADCHVDARGYIERLTTPLFFFFLHARVASDA